MKSSLFWLIVIIIIWMANIKKEENMRIEQDFIKTSVPVEVKKEFQETIHPSSQIVQQAKTVSQFAKENLGKPYVFGTIGPESFDCSGFVYSMHKKVGINLPRTSLNQSKVEGDKISREFLEEGDLVFFDTALEGHVNHSGIYLGDSKFIHASSGKAYSVTISSLDAWYKDKFKWGKRLNANK
ncbi:MAG: Invasion associated protein p60 [uncultured Sulfurovum sp.]|uniref:Invasion associated protein p60 n=1 Tax=uncultured Sulfurovum sp. TaxID=269237 RepID=A0A6S6S460_9BACT|nr:MAG: Invasion associated protein p60 [uncultured Sulfurovum sp.]